MSGPARQRVAAWGGAAAIAAVAVGVRLSVIHTIFTPLGVILPDTDPFYHARRILLALQHFPYVPEFDSYLNFPEGARIYWPAGFDLAMSLVAAAGGGLLDPEHAVGACAIAIPFLALPGVAATGLLARRVSGPVGGFAAAAFLALMPLQVAYSIVGRVDHHVLEPFFLAAVLLAFLRAADAPSATAGDRRAVLAGVLLALGFWFIPTAIVIPAFLAAGVVLARGLSAAGVGAEKGLERPAGITFVTAAIVLVPLLFTSSFGRGGEFSYLGLSWFHEIAVIVSGLAVAGARWLFVRGRVRRLGWGAAVGVAAAAVAALFIARLPAGTAGAAGAIRDAASFLFHSDPLVVNESKSPITVPVSISLHAMTPWLFASPILWLALVLQATRERFTQAGKTLLLGTYPLVFGFYLLQFRFGLMLGVAIALLTGWGIERAWRAYRERSAFRIALPVFAFALLTLLVAARDLQPSTLRTIRRASDPVVRAYLWIRDHTPPTRAYEDPRVRPEYAVLANWEEGHFLTYFARRPNIGNPFAQAPWHIRGYMRASEILLDTDVRGAVARCDTLGIRYLVVQSTPREILSIEAVVQGEKGDGVKSPNPLTHYSQTLHGRLVVFDGAPAPSSSQEVAPSADFRLVYESPEPGEFPVTARGRPPMVPRLIKVFERVRGALLAGNCEKARLVEAKVEVRTNAERRFAFTTATQCGPDGRFSLRLPYARSARGETGADRAYRVRSGARRATVEVTELDVIEGGRIVVEAWPDGAFGNRVRSDRSNVNARFGAS